MLSPTRRMKPIVPSRAKRQPTPKRQKRSTKSEDEEDLKKINYYRLIVGYRVAEEGYARYHLIPTTSIAEIREYVKQRLEKKGIPVSPYLRNVPAPKMITSLQRNNLLEKFPNCSFILDPLIWYPLYHAIGITFLPSIGQRWWFICGTVWDPSVVLEAEKNDVTGNELTFQKKKVYDHLREGENNAYESIFFPKYYPFEIKPKSFQKIERAIIYCLDLANGAELDRFGFHPRVGIENKPPFSVLVGRGRRCYGAILQKRYVVEKGLNPGIVG